MYNGRRYTGATRTTRKTIFSQPRESHARNISKACEDEGKGGGCLCQKDPREQRRKNKQCQKENDGQGMMMIAESQK